MVFRAETGVRVMKTCWSLMHLLLLFEFIRSTSPEGGFCELENGKSNITVDINKSGERGISQLITPEELPIIGDPYTEIDLKLLFSTAKTLFTLNGKRLQLLEALERDEDNLSHITFQVTCTLRNTHKKRTIPAVLRVSGGTADAQNFIGAPKKTTLSETGDMGRKMKRATLEQNNSPGPKTGELMFAQRVYDLQISEASSFNSTVATVVAIHPEKVPVAYSIAEGNDLKQFAVGYKSGVIRVIRKLDRELLRSYQLLIRAEANGGLSSTATVYIKLTDVNDRFPEFVGLPYKFKVNEGEANKTVGYVHAVDLDEGINGQVSYSLPPGVPFAVNETSGEITTTLALDYETQKEYKLVVTAKDGAPDPLLGTATVTVFVQDTEDEDLFFSISEYKTTVPENLPGFMITRVQDRDVIPPVFTTLPEPVTLDDDVAIGTPVTRVFATDSDGTALGNEVKYQLIGRRKAAEYFQIDPDLGLLSVRDHLRKETNTEYQVDIKAYYLGEPSLSSVATLLIYVRHRTMPPSEIGLGFTDDFYNVQVPENATALQLIKTLTVINGNSHNESVIPWNCSIISGNNEDLFYTNVTPGRVCEVRLKVDKLDREAIEDYELRVQLDAPSEFVNPQKLLTTLEIHVTDVNDNKPEFVFPSVGYKRQSPKVYYGAVSWNSGFGTHVLTIKAEDKDSGKFATIYYEIRPSDRGSKYFVIDNATGTILTKQTFENVDENHLPFMFYVVAKDNYLSSCCSNTNEVKIVVNLIDDIHRFILVLDAQRDLVKQSKNEIEEILQEHTGLIVGIEKFSPKQFLDKNKSLAYENSATDIWFYAIDPETEKILDINQTKVQRSIFDSSAMLNITRDVSGKVKATASIIRVPYAENKEFVYSYVEPIKTELTDQVLEVLTYSIIAVTVLFMFLLKPISSFKDPTRRFRPLSYG